MLERVAETGQQHSDSNQRTAQGHQDPRSKPIECKPDKWRSQRINEKIHRCDAGAVAVGPAEIFQEGQIVNAEGTVDPPHHHHVDEAERQNDVAVEELWTHNWIAQFQFVTKLLHETTIRLQASRC
jgi:hypothetical protein